MTGLALFARPPSTPPSMTMRTFLFVSRRSPSPCRFSLVRRARLPGPVQMWTLRVPVVVPVLLWHLRKPVGPRRLVSLQSASVDSLFTAPVLNEWRAQRPTQPSRSSILPLRLLDRALRRCRHRRRHCQQPLCLALPHHLCPPTSMVSGFPRPSAVGTRKTRSLPGSWLIRSSSRISVRNTA